MASKKALLRGVSVKVENRSGFDKSRFNALTTKLGTITPIVKQLVIPGTKGKLSLKVSAKLPPLATDAFLRTHLKVEAFLVPMRLCYGGFESWFTGTEHYRSDGSSFRAELPYLNLPGSEYYENTGVILDDVVEFNHFFGAGSLTDYLGAKFPDAEDWNTWFRSAGYKLNIFPYLAYWLCIDSWYRNKSVEKPFFTRPGRRDPGSSDGDQVQYASALPFVAFEDKVAYTATQYSDDYDYVQNQDGKISFFSRLGSLDAKSIVELYQRNYGDDYFTAARPSAQEGDPSVISTAGNAFTISALRLGNALQQFREMNSYATPDYVQTNMARYGDAPSDGVAQKPILLGSADFPMYTSGVEQTAAAGASNNPFTSVGARYGSAHAEGTDFVCSFECHEPSYLMVLATLVPEANYSTGIAHDMQIFTEEGDLTDLPCALLEGIGNEAVDVSELSVEAYSGVFGYVPRYLWHKAGQINEVHGLFREGQSLQAFIPQRSFGGDVQISSAFLKVRPTDLDDITAVSGDISKYGVMIDSAIDLFISEPLSESALPSLQNPAAEHGHNVYLNNGGSPLA